ncbi:glutathione S-transferase family protein [Ferruginivarius sediminum]|uniref:Glutathione S-transferase family protein n=1 Tax=Ferruginivarius sediminum TaxID=2661937 RepID=A0A369T6G6_9PROT|nr:glutathione S-transferase family protein [Ferruginivarius sediminum]RDD60923.1 glutathione S-transferase family protein [Ferruginivarius sediminum]
MRPVRLFGARYSVYTRIARLVLLESGIPHELEEVDIFRPAEVPSDYAARHPFMKIPAMEHDGFSLYETDAIAAYASALTSAGQDLVPSDPGSVARTRQIMRSMDNYAYPACVWGIYVPQHEGNVRNPVDREAVARAERVLDALMDLSAAPYLLGQSMTLADLWALPMLAYLNAVPTGRELLVKRPKLTDWLQVMRERPSVKTTRFPAEE